MPIKIPAVKYTYKTRKYTLDWSHAITKLQSKTNIQNLHLSSYIVFFLRALHQPVFCIGLFSAKKITAALL